jgi:hypothetical protein
MIEKERRGLSRYEIVPDMVLSVMVEQYLWDMKLDHGFVLLYSRPPSAVLCTFTYKD